MNSSNGRLRLRVLLLAALACVTAMLLLASQASAGTLYACVKKSGNAHVFSKKPKCKKGESKLSWNTSGPAGKNGTNGASGAGGKEGTAGKNGNNGLNGAVAGFGAFETSELDITEGFGEPKPVPGLSKTLPAGSFVAAASVEIDAEGEKNGETATAACALVDTPEVGTNTEAEGKWIGATTGVFIFIFEFHLAQSVITLHSSFKTTTPSTLSVTCDELGHGEKVKEHTANGSMIAVQTSALS